MKGIYARAWFVPAALAGAFLLAFLFRQALELWIGEPLTSSTYTILIFLAGLGAGVATTLLAMQPRDMPWVIHRLYRHLRYHEQARAGDYPLSIRAYLKADPDDPGPGR
jgi:hypothetical protein